MLKPCSARSRNRASNSWSNIFHFLHVIPPQAENLRRFRNPHSSGISSQMAFSMAKLAASDNPRTQAKYHISISFSLFGSVGVAVAAANIVGPDLAAQDGEHPAGVCDTRPHKRANGLSRPRNVPS